MRQCASRGASCASDLLADALEVGLRELVRPVQQALADHRRHALVVPSPAECTPAGEVRSRSGRTNSLIPTKDRRVTAHACRQVMLLGAEGTPKATRMREHERALDSPPHGSRG